MADPVMSQKTIQIEHVKIGSTKTFSEVKTTLESIVPERDAGVDVLIRYGESDRARRELERAPQLSIFLIRDHGGLLQIAGAPRKALQYEIGNALTASRMTQHQLSAALYAPLRVLLYENSEGHATFEYDKPSTLFGQFGDEKVTAVARELDVELERALLRAAK